MQYDGNTLSQHQADTLNNIGVVLDPVPEYLLVNIQVRIKDPARRNNLQVSVASVLEQHAAALVTHGHEASGEEYFLNTEIPAQGPLTMHDDILSWEVVGTGDKHGTVFNRYSRKNDCCAPRPGDIGTCNVEY